MVPIKNNRNSDFLFFKIVHTVLYIIHAVIHATFLCMYLPTVVVGKNIAICAACEGVVDDDSGREDGEGGVGIDVDVVVVVGAVVLGVVVVDVVVVSFVVVGFDSADDGPDLMA